MISSEIASPSSPSRTPASQTTIGAIDRARSHYLCEPSLPVHQHASSREDDTLLRLISAHFLLSRAARGRCSIQGAAMQSSSSTSTGGAVMAPLSLRWLMVRALRADCCLCARQTVLKPVRLTAKNMPLNARCALRTCGVSLFFACGCFLWRLHRRQWLSLLLQRWKPQQTSGGVAGRNSLSYNLGW